MCDHEPIEQIRGNMADGDYFDAVTNSLDEALFRRLPSDYHNYVELDDSNRDDIRIICRKCFLQTGWMKFSAPNVPLDIALAAAQASVRKKWDAIKHHNPETYNAELRASGLTPKIINFGR